MASQSSSELVDWCRSRIWAARAAINSRKSSVPSEKSSASASFPFGFAFSFLSSLSRELTVGGARKGENKVEREQINRQLTPLGQFSAVLDRLLLVMGRKPLYKLFRRARFKCPAVIKELFHQCLFLRVVNDLLPTAQGGVEKPSI